MCRDLCFEARRVQFAPEKHHLKEKSSPTSIKIYYYYYNFNININEKVAPEKQVQIIKKSG